MVGVKLYYFHQAAADPDDRLLREFVEQKIVPPNCLLGGTVVQSLLGTQRKPCHGCNGPRERCGGEPKPEGYDSDRAQEREELRRLFEGPNPNDPITKLLRGL